jgi:hypothetical protein
MIEANSPASSPTIEQVWGEGKKHSALISFIMNS